MPVGMVETMIAEIPAITLDEAREIGKVFDLAPN